MRVQWEGSECGETISFSMLIHSLPLQKGFTYHSPRGRYRFADIISATHQHYHGELCSQPLLQPSLAKLETFTMYLLRDKIKKKAEGFPRRPDWGKFKDTFAVIGSLGLSSCH